jgi:hypothetical protein
VMNKYTTLIKFRPHGCAVISYGCKQNQI